MKTKAKEEGQPYTTLSIKKTTRDRLDRLGDRHQSYDSIINKVLEEQSKPKNEGVVNYIINSIVEDYKEIRYRMQMEGDSPQTTMLSTQVLTMLEHYLTTAEKSGIPPTWNEIVSRHVKLLDQNEQQKKKQVVQGE